MQPVQALASKQWQTVDSSLRAGLCGTGLGLCVFTLSRICERLDQDKKKHWVAFYHYRVVVYTHCQNTFVFKHCVKINLASDVPFNGILKWNRNSIQHCVCT